MGYTSDLARGTAMLGNSAEAYNQIWNLPVDKKVLTGEEWIRLFAKELKSTDKYQVMPGWLMKTLGLFVPVLNEVYEMRYQYDRDYYFDSSKFIGHFDFIPTSNEEAVRKTIIAIRKSETK
jgi:nucleoside-diphosphate-sugar epimerase